MIYFSLAVGILPVRIEMLVDLELDMFYTRILGKNYVNKA